MGNFEKEMKYNARCKGAVEIIKQEILCAKKQNRKTMDISRLELIISVVDQKESGISYKNCEEVAYHV